MKRIIPFWVILLALHLYIGLRLSAAFEATDIARIFWGIYLAASVGLLPMALNARQVRRPWLAWLSLLVMGVFSWLLVLTLLRDLTLLPIALLPGVELSSRVEIISAQVTLVLVALASLLGVIWARRLARIVDVTVPVTDLPGALQDLRIVQLSDIHVGPTIKAGYLKGIVRRVNAQDPDLVVITGDLVDGTVQDLADHVKPLAALQATYGVYFVTGNHDYYSGAEDWIAYLRSLGIRVLLNEHVVIHHGGGALVLAGVTDYSAHTILPDHRSDPYAALAGAPDGALRILLAHQPRSAIQAEAAGFALQISGHTHGGQIWPWNFFVPLQQPFVAGLHKRGRMWIYISRGTGYWGPPMRFGAPSEITRIRLAAA